VTSIHAQKLKRYLKIKLQTTQNLVMAYAGGMLDTELEVLVAGAGVTGLREEAKCRKVYNESSWRL
jgi:hypothetical protein